MQARDPALHAELTARYERDAPRVAGGLVPEAASPDVQRRLAITLETIVRAGRPALTVKNDAIDFAGGSPDDVSAEMIQRLKTAVPVVEPMIPFVGRIDVANHQSSRRYVGTGWLIERDLVVTNRHVAQLMARESGTSFVFRAGRFGDALEVSIDYRHELDGTLTDVARVTEVVWIEPDEAGPDFALLRVADRSSRATGFIRLADSDAQPGTDVVVIGYPARAPASVVLDQQWMDRIYGSVYDVKRAAPGLIADPTAGWTTHDCTTLGGNSGSVVLDLKSGRAVALHFAGEYLLANYAVAASTIHRYLKERPWQGNRRSTAGSTAEAARPSPIVLQLPALAPGQQLSLTIPLSVTVTVGSPSPMAGLSLTSHAPGPEHAARRLFEQHRGHGVLAVHAGYRLEAGRLTDTDCLVVKADPVRLSAVRAAAPASFEGLSVDVRPAALDDYDVVASFVTEAVTSISYNDDDRTGPGFSFDTVDEHMKGVVHVGPERSWGVLSQFLAATRTKLVSSMYEFHARHIADAIGQRLDNGTTLTLVLAAQSRDPERAARPDEFERVPRFEQWTRSFGRKFKNVFVPLGASGLVANAYHIKVTVRDGEAVWLSSGNWKRASQPVIPAESLDDPKVTSRAGNREWHVVLESPTLAERFQNHILADFERSLELGGAAEAVDGSILIDVPRVVQEAPELEAAAGRVLEPLALDRRIRVTPLLTPDQQGKVYCDAVLELIMSARKQLLFQNQYIKMAGAKSGFLKVLVDALIDRAQTIGDVRIILRSGDSLVDDVSALKRRGVDVARAVRRLSATHTKGIVVDGRRVLVGSHNWSAPGVTLNRDASLIFDDEEIAQYYAQAFDIDWDRATRTVADVGGSESVPRVAGDGPVPAGFARMTLSEYLES